MADVEGQPVEREGLGERLAQATEGVQPEVVQPEVVPEGGVPAPAAPPAADATWQGVRDFARQQGVDLPWQDDAVALQQLLESYRHSQRRDFYADLGRRVAPQAEAFTEFLRQRQAPPAAEAQPPWKPPAFKREWLQQVERDPETGVLRAKPGYDPATAEKVQAYAEWRDQFLDSPEEVLGPLVEDRARSLIQQELAGYQQRMQAEALVAHSAAWMFEEQPDPQGRRRLSPAGALYARAAQELWDSGLKDVSRVHALARGQVELAVARQQLLKLQPPPQETPQRAAAEQPASVGGGNTRPSRSAPPAPANKQVGLSLRERLNATLRDFPDEVALT